MSTVKAAYNLMVYGNSGIGKTPWSATEPDSLVLAIDPGTISAARAGSKADVWEIPTWEEFEEAQKWVRAGGYSRYRLIVVDGLTMLRERCLRFILDREHKRNSARDLFIPAQPDHQAVQNMIKFTVEKFCDLPVHMVFTALPMAKRGISATTLQVSWMRSATWSAPRTPRVGPSAGFTGPPTTSTRAKTVSVC
jgi:hypothetical protein